MRTLLVLLAVLSGCAPEPVLPKRSADWDRREFRPYTPKRTFDRDHHDHCDDRRRD